MSRIECPWPDAPPGVRLQSDEIHLWCVWLDDPRAVKDLLAVLSEDERERAARFAKELFRDRFVVGRGMLRAILAKYLAAEPRELQFRYSDYGKPVLAPPWGSHGLRFNLSHCEGLGLLAVAAREVGTDVEHVRPVSDMSQLVERCFSAEEKARWRQLPREAQPMAFFRAWTRKEAWLKAVGCGFSFPLDEVGVTFAPGEPARVLSVRGDAAKAAAWSLDSCEPAPGHVAAVAVHGMPPTRVSRWRWEPRA
jgi:4'-phosphopantetheinyl transferase